MPRAEQKNRATPRATPRLLDLTACVACCAVALALIAHCELRFQAKLSASGSLPMEPKYRIYSEGHLLAASLGLFEVKFGRDRLPRRSAILDTGEMRTLSPGRTRGGAKFNPEQSREPDTLFREETLR